MFVQEGYKRKHKTGRERSTVLNEWHKVAMESRLLLPHLRYYVDTKYIRNFATSVINLMS